MRPVDWRLARNVAILCLPTLAVVALVIGFLVDKVPEIEKAEADRVKAEYREAALTIRQEPEKFPVVARVDEWKPAGKMAPGKWGFSPVRPERFTWVWYDDGRELRADRTTYLPETDYRTLLWSFGILFLLVLVGVTAFGIRYFVGYVKSRDDFMAATAHDLTTPLVAMRHLIGRDDGEAANLNERMLRLVENIKAFMRLGGKRPRPLAESVDPVAVFRSAYALFRDDYRELFDGRDVPLEAENAGVKVLADETLLTQIVWNLLGNDLKYAAPYGAVKARIFRDGGRVVFELVDEGRGMAPREMAKAFDRYYRAKTVLESGKGGFGIGLCNAREFARAMGGELTVRANVPRGCVFVLALPAAAEGEKR